jgi:hypothetical protein
LARLLLTITLLERVRDESVLKIGERLTLVLPERWIVRPAGTLNRRRFAVRQALVSPAIVTATQQGVARSHSVPTQLHHPKTRHATQTVFADSRHCRAPHAQYGHLDYCKERPDRQSKSDGAAAPGARGVVNPR